MTQAVIAVLRGGWEKQPLPPSGHADQVSALRATVLTYGDASAVLVWWVWLPGVWECWWDETVPGQDGAERAWTWVLGGCGMRFSSSNPKQA